VLHNIFRLQDHLYSFQAGLEKEAYPINFYFPRVPPAETKN